VRSRLLFLTLISGFTLWALPSLAALTPIVPDGNFDDWSTVPLLGTDASGDGGTVDFGAVWAANDQDWLYLRFDVGGEIQPDEGQDVVLYLDTDMNSSTGQSIQGIGADMVWELGVRTGTFYTPSANSIGHSDVGLRISPTVSSTQFEMAFDRNAVPAAGKNLFSGSALRFVLEDRNSGDTAPDSGSFTYNFAAGTLAPVALPTSRGGANHLRVATWNIQSDGLFNGGSTEAAQQRMAQVIDPDVFLFEEVWNNDANAVAAQTEVLLPSGPGETWNAVKLDSGNVICTRLPILNSWELFPGHRLTAALLDAGAVMNTEVLVIANHWRCCTADANRQDEADALVAFLRDARSPGGVIDLTAGTPILIGGDFNLVGLSAQLVTALTGNIADNGTWGPDSPPDWDGSNLDAVPSHHVDARESYTWRRDSSSFYPGLLDWIFYTGSAVELGNHFVLETRSMQSSTLTSLGLNFDDTTTASDHAPSVADFYIAQSTGNDPVPQRLGHSLRVYPNPANPRARIEFELAKAEVVEVTIYDAAGRYVRSLARGAMGSGPHEYIWDGSDDGGSEVASGVYFVRVEGETQRSTKSMALVR
jgi:FlgD Ig-like domain/Endonuclease/Exonuclease/phosphatase family